MTMYGGVGYSAAKAAGLENLTTILSHYSTRELITSASTIVQPLLQRDRGIPGLAALLDRSTD